MGHDHSPPSSEQYEGRFHGDECAAKNARGTFGVRADCSAEQRVHRTPPANIRACRDQLVGARRFVSASFRRHSTRTVGTAGQDVVVAKLDPEWAINEIDLLLRATDQVAYDNSVCGVVIIGTHMRGSETEASQRAHVVEQILDRVLSGWSKERPKKDSEYGWLRDQASRAKAALQRAAELAEKLGDNAPDMDAANLHPWAWETSWRPPAPAAAAVASTPEQPP